MSGQFTCEACDRPFPALYVTSAGELCFACVPESIRARYPGWPEREAQSQRRAQLARQNFHKEASPHA